MNTLKEVFDVLNEKCNYLVLRNWDEFEKDKGDIDLLTDDKDKLVEILGLKKVFPEDYRVHYSLMVGEKEYRFDVRYIGDDYYPKEFEERLLKSKVLHENGFYVPIKKDYFLALLYHALIHKQQVKPAYACELTSYYKELPKITLVRDLGLNEIPTPKDKSVFFNRNLITNGSLDQLIGKGKAVRKKRIGLMLGIPTLGDVTIEFFTNWYKAGALPIGMSYIMVYAKGFKFPECHEQLVEAAIRNNCKYLLVMEDDVLFPVDGVKNLLDTMEEKDADIVCGVYYLKDDTRTPLIWKEEGLPPNKKFTPGEIFPIEAGTLGCCLIKIESVQKMKRPFFAFKSEEQGRRYATTDFYFFDKARDHGLKIWCDTRVLCGHIDKTSKEHKIYPEGWGKRTAL